MGDVTEQRAVFNIELKSYLISNIFFKSIHYIKNFNLTTWSFSYKIISFLPIFEKHIFKLRYNLLLLDLYNYGGVKLRPNCTNRKFRLLNCHTYELFLNTQV